MSFNNWLQNFRSVLAPGRGRRNHRRRGSLRSATHRLHFEPLEDRRLLAFLAPVVYDVGTAPQAVATADFNNDGWLDVASVNVGDNTVSVLLGSAGGTFQPAQSSAIGSYPLSVAVGDFDDDGKPDLATANDDGTGGNDISILLGNGDGTFAPAIYQSIDSNLWPLSIATGDLNGDGKADLVVTSDDPGGFSLDIYVSVRVLLGQGDGTFTHAATSFFGSDDSLRLSSPVLADFNNDGNDDVAVALYVDDSQTLSVKVLLGNGNGTLQPARSTNGAYSPSFAVGDFTGDGILDVVTTGSGSGWVDVLPGRGDGTFAAGIRSVAYLAGSITPADFNGDGKLDVVTSYWSSDSLSVLLGRGDGTFLQSDEPWAGWSIAAVAVGDFNGDGRPDVAAADWGVNAVSVLLNDGNWASQPPTPPAVSIRDVTVNEGNTGTRTATFIVTLSAASNQPVTVTYATANGTATGSDYQIASGTLTIPTGQTTGAITVMVIGDRVAEPNETLFVNLSNPTGATIADGQGTATITDDEPRVSISDVTKSEGRRNKTTLFTFTVTLSAAYDEPVTMSFQTGNGTATTSDNDYVAKSGTLTFAPGETTKTITIEVKGDSKKEASETFYLDLFGLIGNASFTKNRGIGTILNDD